MVGAARAGHAAAVADGRIYIVGGHSGFGPVKTLEVFTPGDGIDSPGEWQELAPMQSRRAYLSAAVVDGQLYAFCGSCDGRSLNTFEVYDLESGTWAPWFRNNPASLRRTMHAAALHSLQGQLCIVGGFDGFRDLQSMEGLNLQSQNWERKEGMWQARSYHALAATSAGLYAIGGQDRNDINPDHDDENAVHTAVSALADVEFFDFDMELWQRSVPMDTPRQASAAATLTTEEGDELVYVCGGSDGNKPLASVEVLDVKTGHWSEGPPMNAARLSHAVVALNGRLYAIGGHDGCGPLDTFECFDPAEGRWSKPIKMGGPTIEAIADA